MPDPIVVGAWARIARLLIKPVIYIARAFTDQTKLTLLFPRAVHQAENTAYIFEQEPSHARGVGLFYFGVTTTAEHEVEVVEVALYYATPLELKNPGSNTFFENCQSPNPARPFGIRWQGSTIVTKSIIQTFGVEVHFNDQVRARDVSLAIKARRRVPERGGFEAERRNQRILIFRCTNIAEVGI